MSSSLKIAEMTGFEPLSCGYFTDANDTFPFLTTRSKLGRSETLIIKRSVSYKFQGQINSNLVSR